MSNLLFVGGAGGSNVGRVLSFDMDTMVLSATSIQLHINIQAMTSDSGDTYTTGNLGGVIKIDNSTLTEIIHNNYTNYSIAIDNDEDYIYQGRGWSLPVSRKIYKFNKSLLSTEATSQTTEGVLDCICNDENYVYAGTEYYAPYTNQGLYVFNKSDLSTAQWNGVDALNYQGINRICVDDDYIYGAAYRVDKHNITGATAITALPVRLTSCHLLGDILIGVAGSSIYKINKNTLAIIDSVATSGGTYDVVNDGTYVYVAITTSNSTGNVLKYKLSDFSFIAATTELNFSPKALTTNIEDPPEPVPEAPTNLTATTIGDNSIDIQWVNNSLYGDNILVQFYINGNWITQQTLGLSEDTATLNNLHPYTTYTIRVALDYNGLLYPSNTIVEKTLSLPPPLCDEDWTDRFTVVDSTCGNVDGQVIFINPEYLKFYDVILRDNFGNYKYFDDTPTSPTFGQSQYLFAGWYAVQATPKPAYSDYYGNEECRFTWIPVAASNTTMSLDNVSIRDVVCGGFGAIKGRIVYFMSDTVQNTYQFYLYKDIPNEIDGELLDFQDNLTYSQFQQIVEAPLDPATYYAIGYNKSNGCILLMGGHTIAAKQLRAVAGVRRVFVTEWNNQIEYNYWSESDEDYYVSGVDSDFFNSIKIKEFIDSTLPSAWFEIVLDTKGILYNQTMNKTHQGFIFTDSMEITIPHADNVKWKQLVDFLVDRYIIVFQDNNSQWWTMGYRLGAKADSYKRANNEYILTLNAISDNKILTNIDETYVNDNIINS